MKFNGLYFVKKDKRLINKICIMLTNNNVSFCFVDKKKKKINIIKEIKDV